MRIAGGKILRKLSIISGLTGLVVLAACGRAPEQTEATNRSAAPEATVVGNNMAAAAPASAPARPPVLEGEGLRIGTEKLGFGAAKAATIAALTRALGRPPGEQGTNEECGGGALEYATWPDEITLYFESGGFAGWDERGKLRTADGIGLGSSRPALASLPGLEVEESTLGIEFTSGGLGGILDSDSPTAKVTNMWGGSTCVFR
ncbi:MAG: hypothetical protein QOG72_2609 [Sphingomonadales bacterium]|nr:hypothetical protein [Sphingomonadales bacterium]